MSQVNIENLKKLFADFKFQEIIDIINLEKSPPRELLELKASSLFELGDFKQAAKIYEKLEMFTNLGFCFLLENDFEKAKQSYLKAKPSSAKKWGLFLTLLFSRTDKVFPGPGFLTFRLFFESSYYYLLKFQKIDFMNRINECVHQLKPLYPDIEKEIEKAKSII